MRAPATMMKRAVLSGLAFAVVACGCARAPHPARFYTLTAIQAPSAVPRPDRASAASCRLVGLGSVQIPDALDRPQIVTRVGSNRFHLSEHHRWAGALDREIARVLAENLQSLLPGGFVVTLPWDGQAAPGFRVSLDIRRFDGMPGENATLDATWILAKGSGGAQLAMGRFLSEEKVSRQGFDALVAAQSRLLEALSRQIANALDGFCRQADAAH